MIHFRFLIIILVMGNLLCAHSYAHAQPEGEDYDHLIRANSLFHDGEYEEALVNYQIVLDRQPSNNYALDQIRKAEDELLYIKIIDASNAGDDCFEYMNKFGDEGKYIIKVKNILSQHLLSRAYKYYQNKEIELLENIYIEYLTLLGSVQSNEMKQWLYSLCNEEAVKHLRKKDWKDAKLFFERSLKYAGTNSEFKDAQKGIARASKKIK